MLRKFILITLICLFSILSLSLDAAKVDTKNPRIKVLKDTPIVGLLKTGSFKDMNYPQVWEEFFSIYQKSQHKSNSQFYGTMYWDANTPETEDMTIHYMVGIPEKVMKKLDVPFEKHVIKGGQYAVFIHQGPVFSIQGTYEYIYGTWFRSSGYKDRYGDVFEYYDKRFKDNDPSSIVEIWVPVEKK